MNKSKKSKEGNGCVIALIGMYLLFNGHWFIAIILFIAASEEN